MHAPLLVLLLAFAGDPLESFRRARGILDRAMTAHAVSVPPSTIALSLHGTIEQLTQSPRSEPPFLQTPHRETLLLDLKGQRLRHSRETEWPYFTMKRTTVATRTAVADIDDTLGTASAGGRFETVRRRVNWRSPALLLLAARDAGAGLRYAGRDGAAEVLVFPQEDGQVMTLMIDARSHRVLHARWLEADPLFGDVVWETSYSGDRIVQRSNGVVVATLTFTQRSDVPIEEASFVAPALQPAAAPPAMSFDELAAGVMLIRNVGRGDYHSLLVLFGDHSVLVEPVGAAATARQLIAEISARFPRQPLRFVAATHHHDDHVAALRGYFAAGVTLLSPRSNAAYFRAIATARHTIAGAAPIAGDRVREVALPHRIADATNELVLLSAGPTEHAEEMTIAWLPRAGIVFQGDLFRGGTMEAPRKSTLQFAAALERLGITPQRIAGAHGEVVSFDALRGERPQPR